MSTTTSPSEPTTLAVPSFELRATTEAGAAMVAAAEDYAEAFAAGALAHDRDATFATEHLEALRAGGFLAAPVPAHLGGGDVLSVHDLLVACSRLARGDAATTIGVNMHFAVIQNLVRHWRVACTRESAQQAHALEESMRLLVGAGVVLATAVSEPGGDQDLTRPRTRAVRVDGGWSIDGTKAFATMAPAATLLNVAVTYEDDDCVEHYGFALVPVDSAGVEFHDDWDALGMRASASGSVSFRDVRVGHGDVRDQIPVGRFSTALLDRFLVSGALHAAASLGIAESAHARIVDRLRSKADRVVTDPHAAMRLAESAVDLFTMRAAFDRAGRLIDDYHAAFPAGDAPAADAQGVYAEVQAAKTHLNEAGSRVVDRALALSGGAGFLAGNPLSKAWRDARAGAFMHPLGVNRAYDFLARTSLGVTPRLG